MTRQLTDSERDGLLRARVIYDHKTEPGPSIGFDAGFAAGLAFNQYIIADLQATLDRERAERLAYQEIMSSRLQELVDSMER